MANSAKIRATVVEEVDNPWDEIQGNLDPAEGVDDPIYWQFRGHLNLLEMINPKEYRWFLDRFVNWAAYKGYQGSESNWVANHIGEIATRNGVTPAAFIDWIFTPVGSKLSADTIFERFAVGASWEDILRLLQ